MPAATAEVAISRAQARWLDRHNNRAATSTVVHRAVRCPDSSRLSAQPHGMDSDGQRPQPDYPQPDVELAAGVGVLAAEVATGRPELRHMLRTQRWKRYGRVVVCHNGPLTPEQFVWVAVLRSPRGVVLAAMTAATGRGLRWEVPLRPQLLVPAAGPLPHLTGVDVRRTRLLEAVDVHPTAQPPQLRLSRALLDQATLLRRPDDVRAVLCAGVQQRMVRAGDLREVTVRMGPLRHRALLLRTIDDMEGGAHSVRELAFGRLMATSGLPQPSRQVVRQRSGGRHYLDAVWEDYALHVELDGLGHLVITQWDADCYRHNELELGKQCERRLRIPGFWVDERQDRVVDQISRGLLAGGWDGTRLPRPFMLSALAA